MLLTVRLFSALVPPAEVLDSLERELARLGPSDARLRWAGRPRWHLTLAFYGEDDLDGRTAWLAPRLTGLRPLRLQLAGAGTFPGVLWAGVAGDVDDLQALAAATGAGVEGRPYHPHITLARWKQPRRPPSVRPAVSALRDYRGPLWQASEVVLMRSEQSGHPSEGPRYTVQARFPLA